MATGSLALRLDAPAVDPATVAYLRDLVGALQGKCFNLACENQVAGDLFRLRPEPSFLPGVPDEVAWAINTLEELLRKGSPALAAYGRHVIRLKRAQQEEALGAAMAEVVAVDNVLVGHYDAFDATRAHLLATQHAKQQLVVQIAAVACSPGIVEAGTALMSLLLELGMAEEREEELEVAVRRMIPNFVTMFWHLEVAKARVEAMEAALEAIPDLPGDWNDDMKLICDGAERFDESVQVLREFMV
ncbi:hypothetical protein E2562_013742 [Oryza meyeriana var. granulata]|uniref:Uncharacterized protein n=1 Tax=Oryza meyeriana var. granulata TaxID=110450 RepID=A0A6G1BK10_9ORYZ|nr:hypothetical protein E2562_013742 [Oryza meyeriana var. granulata]